MITNKNLIITVLMTGWLAVSCNQSKEENPTPDNNYMQLATLWYQQSAECRALYYQAYEVARFRLDEALKIPSKEKKAVVVDIDETVLDNSPYQAWCILTGKNYPEGWAEWTSKAEAKALPGAGEFLNYAASKGVEVFYITNRKTNEMEATIKNLQKEGFPMADTLHVIPRTDVSNKESRRQRVAQNHKIVLLAGDNLNDFAEFWEKQSPLARQAITDSLKAEFGRRFIILPNPMYGDWENALYEYKYGLMPAQKDSIRRKFLKGF
ncbi:MAG: 5'-nucleotidase, lipoprotein e(P4) family [Bacteroidales bacterium]|nr:5'-nucleotidase, lipoprotein e(P4) family [Bacteroidales bacterium]